MKNVLNSQMKIKFKTLLLLTFLLMIGKAQENMYGTLVQTEDKTVSAETTFQYNLNFQTVEVENNDYLLITLPSGDQACKFVFPGRALCSIQNSLLIKQCTIISETQAKIVFTRQSSSGTINSLQGSIQLFKNPSSSKPQQYIKFEYFDNRSNLKAVENQAQLSFFSPTGLDVAISSSSNVVGKSSATLTLNVTPKVILAEAGSIQLKLPEYYPNAGSDFMVEKNSLKCSAESGVIISDCSFDAGSRTIKWTYRFVSGRAKTTATTFYLVNCFKNPISPEPMGGFSVLTSDSEDYGIGQSEDITLSGVTQPNDFQYVRFSFDQVAGGSNVVGEHNFLTLNIGINNPLVKQCFFKFVFPEELSIDSSHIEEAEGSSYFLQSSTSKKIIFFDSDFSQRYIILKACEVNNGASTVGYIRFRVINPNYVVTTGSFEIYLASDSEFTKLIAIQTSGILIDKNNWQTGSINTASVTSTNLFIGQQTYLKVYMVPSTNIDASQGSRIALEFTQVPILSKSCQISNANQQLSSRVSCQVVGSIFYINDAFTNKNFEGGKPIAFQVGPITNPSSVQDMGSITIQTEVRVDNAYYLVDKVILKNQLKISPGKITAFDATEVSILETYNPDASYIFSLRMEHDVPVGGFIRATLPSGMKVVKPTFFQSNCFRLNSNNDQLSNLKCSIYQTNERFQVQITNSEFGSSGLKANEELKLQVVSILSPREVNRLKIFEFESTDSNGYQIDYSGQQSNLGVKMQTPSTLKFVEVFAKNQTNGALTTYTFEITPNTYLQDDDRLLIQFPDEILLSMWDQRLDCSGEPRFIYRLRCDQDLLTKQVMVTFEQIKTIGEGQKFEIYINDVMNPPSLRRTSSFPKILLTDKGLQEIAYYDRKVWVENKYVSNLLKYELRQESKEPDIETQYMIQFTTNNFLPTSSAILIRMPQGVSVIRDQYDCYVITNQFEGQNTKQGKSSRNKRVCDFQESSAIRFTDIFEGQENWRGLFRGQVSVYFRARNPSSNSKTDLSLQLTIFDRDDFYYPIDQILDGLNPTFQCQYPCLTCSSLDPSNCASCPLGKYEPNFLQISEDGLSRTCQMQCNSGYTYNPFSIEKVCIPCDPTCKTCRTGGGLDDSKICLSCSDDYPVFWSQGARCFSQQDGCPSGTYQSNTLECSTCESPCIECTTKRYCTYCDPFSEYPLLQNMNCRKRCFRGFTATYRGPNRKGECIPCEEPCATCAPGSPAKCTSCGDGEKQFLFGTRCVEVCPDGTQRDMESKQCTGCLVGCKHCSEEDNSICLECQEGTSLLNNECYTTCPPEYEKSYDGTVCELRQYPLDEYYVPFPFICLLIVFYLIILTSYVVTQKTTLLVQNMIAATSLVLVVCLDFQIIAAGVEGNQPLPILACLFILLTNLIINVAYMVTFHLQVEDFQFGEYIKFHTQAWKAIQILCIVFSLHLFRLSYSKLFKLPIFHAATSQPSTFYKPMMLYSLIQLGCVCVPVFLSNIYFAASTRSRHIFDNQSQCTVIELLILSVLLSGLIIYERFYNHPKYLNFRPDMDAMDTFYEVFGDRGGPEPPRGDLGQTTKGGDGGAKGGDNKTKGGSPTKMPLKKKMPKLSSSAKLDRHKQLKQMLSILRANFENGLNVNLDQFLVKEIPVPKDKQDSMPSPRLRPIVEDDGSFDPINYSWEGVLPEWEGDGTDKRLKLLAWMEIQEANAALKERNSCELQQKIRHFADKSMMYDNEMYDNVFFSAKSYVDNEVEMSITMREQAQQYSEFNQPSLVAETDEEEKERREQEKREQALDAKKKKKQAKLDRLRNAEVQTSKVNIVDPTIQATSVKDSTSKPPSAAPPADESIQKPMESINFSTIKQNVILDESVEMQNLLNDSASKSLIKQSTQKSLVQPSAKLSEVEHTLKSSQANQKFKSSRDLTSQALMSKKLSENTPIQPSQDVLSQSSYTSKGSFKSQKSEVLSQTANQKSQKSLKSQKSDKKSSTSVLQSEKILKKPPKLGYKKTAPPKLQSEMQSENRSQLCEVEESFVVSESKAYLDLLETADLIRIDHLRPGPETAKWQERIKLFKTLLLDCRDPATNPKNRRIHERHEHSDTDKTALNNDPGNIGHQKQIEDLQSDPDEGYQLGDSGSSLGDEWFEHNIEPRTGWERDNISLNRRTFNIFSILGEFPIDNYGRIKNLHQVLEQMEYKDLDGKPVNELGYLVNETNGAIYSKFTFEDQFWPIADTEDHGDIPLPYRLERFNFNAHKIFGNFDFDLKLEKPIFLRNKHDQLTDKNFRVVNASGFLINEKEDIIDNEGEIKFKKELLTEKDDLQFMYNFKGEKFRIQDIVGIVKKDDNSKDIIFKIDKETQRAVDELGRPINAQGYLVDNQGSIINKKGEIIWHFWELVHQEPPKLFPFTQWSLNWIRGDVEPGKQINFAANQDHVYDRQGKLINVEGYLIDKAENVIDNYGRIVFPKELLSYARGQDCQVPPVFLMGVFLDPYLYEEEEISEDLDRDQDPSYTMIESQSQIPSVQPTYVNPLIGALSEDKSVKLKSVVESNTAASHQTKIHELSQTAESPKMELKKKKKKPKKLKRANSTTSEVPRYGKRVLGLYQQYLDGDSEQVITSLQPETIGGQKVKPVLVTPSIKNNNLPPPDYTLARVLPFHPKQQQSDSESRIQQSQTQLSIQKPISVGATSALGHPIPHPRINQMMMNDNKTPQPERRAQLQLRDNSYAARAEQIFNENRNGLSRDDANELLNPFSMMQASGRNTPMQKQNLTDQIEKVTNIYSRKRK